jgi:hypothetical protein
MFTNEYSLFFRICRHAIFNEVETIVIGKLKFVCDLRFEICYFSFTRLGFILISSSSPGSTLLLLLPGNSP